MKEDPAATKGLFSCLISWFSINLHVAFRIIRFNILVPRDRNDIPPPNIIMKKKRSNATLISFFLTDPKHLLIIPTIRNRKGEHYVKYQFSKSADANATLPDCPQYTGSFRVILTF